MKRVLLPLAVAVLLITSGARSGSAAAAPPLAPVPVLVELFTSEGCSSCPPADELLIDLVAKQPVEGVFVVGLSEHVDYWNQLGWSDPFSSAAFSARQNAYARVARTDRVYTPQAVVDGRNEIVGSDRESLLRAIRQAGARVKAVIDLAWTAGDAPGHELRVTIAGAPGLGGADVYLAVAEDGLATAVGRGENAGRTLRHAAVTRRLTKIGRTEKDGAFRRVVDVALLPEWKPAALHVVAFAQRDGGPILAIAARPVDRPATARPNNASAPATAPAAARR